jgi:acyl-CoA synthetase (AMP-forming)/AMP-acid ligase II
VTALHPGVGAVPFAAGLAAYGDQLALATPGGPVTYRELAARVADAARLLGAGRRLVLLATDNSVDTVVGYLAALTAGHPVLLAPADRPDVLDSLVAAYDPDVVWRAGGPTERRLGTAHDLHPELALLLSTSGSTGSPRLVRLSRHNLQANAESIAVSLGIRPDDRAATTLPLHYCYGLSVLNSHLLRGAGLILTGLSVADPTFWALFRKHRGTTFAGVPYTFELLDRVGFADLRLPDLRYVTQAGGRLAPERVRRYAELGRRRGWDLVVMYGQTEATARMAYLPPELAAGHPDAIGVPVPGGSFRLEPLPDWPDGDTGELVYTGPNVMLGYATGPADLALGRTATELRTGDVARRTPDGLHRVVGRRSRFLKILGLRIDLGRVEAVLERHGVAAGCVGDDEELVVAVTVVGRDAELRRLVARECGLPPRAVRVRVLAELPRLPSGKLDHPALAAAAAATADPAPPASAPPPVDLCRLYADVLGAPAVSEDSTFVGLGGDSLSYVAMSVRLERALGQLPADWPTTPIRELRAAARRPARWRAPVDTGGALRAVAIVLVVGTHAALFDLPGGAHLLLVVAGFNLARLHLATPGRAVRARRIARAVLAIAVPSMLWIGLAFLLTDRYDLAHVLLLDYVLGPPGGRNDYWFVETICYLLLGVLALLAVPAVDRLERRLPYGLPLGLVAIGLLGRYQLVPAVHFPTPVVVLWLFALGWAAARATSRWQRLVLTAVLVATIPGFHHDLSRELLMIAGAVLLVWVPALPSARPVNRAVAVVAGASLAIYLTHWQVLPLLPGAPLAALLASLAVGIGYAAAVRRVSTRLARRRPAVAVAVRTTES